MEFYCVATNRDEFISAGHIVGEIFRSRAAGPASAIAFGGDENSGKSLFALAIDQVFRPQA